MEQSEQILVELCQNLGVDINLLKNIGFNGAEPVGNSPFPLASAASAAIAMHGLAADRLWQAKGRAPQHISVDLIGAFASLIGFALQNLSSGETPERDAQNPVSQFFQTKDGRWVHLHGGFPHLAQGIVDLLGCELERDAIGRAVATWDAQELENAVAERKLCGVMARTQAEWRAHPQGQHLAALPVVQVTRIGDAPAKPLPAGDRPLSGVRVMDLTRVLAGPTCARTLASHGADVLRISGPGKPFVPAFVMDTGHGKRTAELDLDRGEGMAVMHELLKDADVFSQSYRKGALSGRGLSPEALAEQYPGIVYVNMNCFGYDGPWANRPGWEQLAQTATGIALEQGTEDAPQLLPAAATDYTTGYLAAIGAMVALERRAREGGSYLVTASLSQTAMWLQGMERLTDWQNAGEGLFGAIGPFMQESETPYGTLKHLGPVLQMSDTPPRWEQPTSPLGSHAPLWNSK